MLYPEFLTKLPEDIEDDSCITVDITRDDGQMVAFADGFVPGTGGNGWGPMKRLSDVKIVEYADYAEAVRNGAKIFAQRRFQRLNKDE